MDGWRGGGQGGDRFARRQPLIQQSKAARAEARIGAMLGQNGADPGLGMATAATHGQRRGRDRHAESPGCDIPGAER